MRLAVLVITDGRDDYLARTVDSAAAMLEVPDAVEWWMYDDTGDARHRDTLADAHREYTQIPGTRRLGFGGAIRHAWAWLTEHSRADWVFHLEGDFVFRRRVPLMAMAQVLADNPHLVQMALLRQPWNAEERAAGGIVQCHPEAYVERSDVFGVWLEHRQFFTTNPSVYRRSLCARGWPDGRHSEGHFGLRLFAEDPTARAAFWGGAPPEPWVHHIGAERVGTGY